MEKYIYHADVASVKIGSADGTCQFHIDNGLGDGTFAVSVVRKGDAELGSFAGSFQGKDLILYDYDCSGAKELCRLSGSFLAHKYDNGNICLEKISDDMIW